MSSDEEELRGVAAAPRLSKRGGGGRGDATPPLALRRVAGEYSSPRKFFSSPPVTPLPCHSSKQRPLVDITNTSSSSPLRKHAGTFHPAENGIKVHLPRAGSWDSAAEGGCGQAVVLDEGGEASVISGSVADSLPQDEPGACVCVCVCVRACVRVCMCVCVGQGEFCSV